MKEFRLPLLFELMRKDKETIQRYKDFLIELQNHLYDTDAKEIATVLSITLPSVYLRRKDPLKIKFLEQKLLADFYQLDASPLGAYLELIEGIDLRIKQSSWKKLSLMQRMGIGAARALLLTRNPHAWQLYEVEKIVDLLITSEEI